MRAILLNVMADEPITVTEPNSAVDGATADAGAGASESQTSTTDAPGFDKGSFSDVLERISTGKTEPDKAEPTDDTPKPEESETKVEPKKDELPPEAPRPEDEEDEGEDLELLSDEEIDAKHPKAPKPLRDYAKRISKQYEPYVQAVDELGGIDAVKRLDKMQTIALGVPNLEEGGNVDQLHDQIVSLNPAMAEAYKQKVFYSALDDPKDAETLLNPFIQADERYKDFTYAKLKELADMVIDGEINLEEIKEKQDAERPEEAEKRRIAAEKTTADEAEKADLRKRIEATETVAKQAEVEKEVIRIRGIYAEKTDPVLKKFGLGKDFIKPTDSDEIKQVKQAYLDDLEHAVGRRMYDNALVQNLAERMYSPEKGDGYAWLVERCATIYKGIVREEAMKRQGLLSGFLKSYGQPVKETQTRRPEPDADARTAAHARTAATEEAPKAEEREGGLGRLIAQKAAEKVA